MKNSDRELVGLLVIMGFVFHLFALTSDAEQVKENLRSYKKEPSKENLARLLLADGVFVEDTSQFLT